MNITPEKQAVRAELARRFQDDAFLLQAIQGAVRAAIREHKRADNPIAAWKDGHVVWIAPEDIDVPDAE